uniref:Uncharacterized protein n=1 Tax=Arundo donax TaxID=35708 RepID=A0A0A9GF26_ARUDO
MEQEYLYKDFSYMTLTRQVHTMLHRIYSGLLCQL